MSTIVTRLGKGSPLTFTEEDANFTNLNTDKYESGNSPTFNVATVTTINVTTANVTTANVTTANVTTANVTTANVTTLNATSISVATITVSTLADITGGQIKFPATQVPSSNVNTLDDYEEGTWTPTDGSGAGLSFTGVAASYVKIGQLVTWTLELSYPATASGSSAIITGLPFTSHASGGRWSGTIGYRGAITQLGSIFVSTNSVQINLYNGATNTTNANCSGGLIILSGSYKAAA
jgi:hypothetical protein